MNRSTLILVGPGGVGKGPLANLIRDYAVAIDPYRLRPEGPRKESDDPLYAHPKLRTEIHGILSGFGETPRQISCEPEKMEWFPRAKVLFFTVRGMWQCLILQGLEGEIAKAELYAPVLPAMLKVEEIREAIGCPVILVLNPAPTPLLEMLDWQELESKTRENCAWRGDSSDSVEKRVRTIRVEAPAWRALIAEQGAIELTSWAFPEFRFKKEDERELLRQARSVILRGHPQLGVFLKPEDAL
jgi:hypothetical protein